MFLCTSKERGIGPSRRESRWSCQRQLRNTQIRAMRKPAKLLLTAAAALLLLALALHLLLQPQRVTGFVLNALGDALGLEITATGSSEYRLRGTPVLVVHYVGAREPGAATPLLRARRGLGRAPCR